MNQIDELLVVKRSGEIVEFDPDRIKNAIEAAINAGDEGFDLSSVPEIVDGVHQELSDRFTEFYPNVENIQDIVEKLLIGSFNVYYHHEHHLNAKIPYYNLEKFHHMIKNDVSELINAPIYEKGYFTAALRTVLVPKEQLEIHSG